MQLRTATLLSVIACGPIAGSSGPTTETGSSSTTGTSTTDPSLPTTTGSAGSTATSTTGDSPDTGSSSGQNFIPTPDSGDPHYPCDAFAQDCPAGQKCVPWAEDGNAWDGTRCATITGDGAPGDPCTAPEGVIAGMDDCDFGAICWYVDENNQGTCIAQCLGTSDRPICPAASSCDEAAAGGINLCLPWCDPLPDSCPKSSRCLPTSGGFECVHFDNQPLAQLNEGCVADPECDGGLFCLDAEDASNSCAPDIGCCQPFCAFPGGACPNADQACIPWFDAMGAIPPGYEDLGFCGIP